MSWLVLGDRVTAPAGQSRGEIRVRASLGWVLETGRCQTPRGECLHKGTKEFGTEEQGEHSPSGISGTRGVLEHQRRFEDSRGTSREEVSCRAVMRQM